MTSVWDWAAVSCMLCRGWGCVERVSLNYSEAMVPIYAMLESCQCV